MIREQFLQESIRQNLFGLRILRDIAAVMQTGIQGETSRMLKFERVKTLAENSLARLTFLAKGFVISETKTDNQFITSATKNCEAQTMLLGVELDSKITDDCSLFLRASAIVPVGERGSIFDECLKISEHSSQYAIALAKLIQDVAVKQNQGKILSGFCESLLIGFGQMATDCSVVALKLAKKEISEMLPREELVNKLRIILSESVDISNNTLRLWLVANSEDVILTLKRLADSAAGGVLRGTLAPLTYDLCYRYCLLGKNV